MLAVAHHIMPSDNRSRLSREEVYFNLDYFRMLESMYGMNKLKKIWRMWGYWLLLLLESSGELVLLIKGIPALRGYLTRQGYEAGPPLQLALWLWGGVFLIQVGYWVNHYLAAQVQTGRNVVLGNVLLFVGRLNFIVVSSAVSATFLVKYEQVNFSFQKLIFMFVVMFSVFCFSMEIERLGRQLSR